MSWRRGWQTVVVVSALAGAACGGGDDDGGGAAEAVVTTTSAPTTSTAAADDAAVPEALVGGWTTTVAATGEPASLRFRANGGYQISRGGGAASGSMTVEGDELELGGNNLCDGVGRYRWVVGDDDVLVLTELEPDPCTARAAVLVGQGFARSE